MCVKKSYTQKSRHLYKEDYQEKSMLAVGTGREYSLSSPQKKS